MTIYIDILFLNNTLMTYAIIWSVARILDYKSAWWRLLLAAVAGTLYTFIIIYADTILWQNFYRYIFHISLNIAAAMLITYISFGKLVPPKFIKAVGFLYLISFICVGAILSVIYIFGLQEINDKNTYIFLTIGLILLLLLGFKGWKIFHSYVTPGKLLVPVYIYFQQKQVVIQGLIDTGNSLNDPITNVPVIITEYNNILELFPPELKNILAKEKGGIINSANDFARNDMGERVRLLPFSDLGQEHGMLLGFRPDKVEVLYENNKIHKNDIILALTDRKLDEDDNYQALVNPRILS